MFPFSLPSDSGIGPIGFFAAVVVALVVGFIVIMDQPPQKTWEQRHEEWRERIYEDCTFMGFKPGTDPHANCQLQVRIQ